jgi:transposase-like protein
MFLKEFNSLLDTGYVPIETGYCRLPDGQFYVAVLTRMPGCKVRWLDWWFNTVILKRIGQEPKSTTGMSKYLKKSKNDYFEHRIRSSNGKITSAKFQPVNPAMFFDIEKIKNSQATIITCSELVADGIIQGQVIHVAHNTEYGCELKSRFLWNNHTEEKTRIQMERFIRDINNLADFLKIVIEKIKLESNKQDISCKYCFGDDVVKYGLRKNGQYWRCNSCGHCFMNNGALPKMKYPLDIIAKAVNEYHTGIPARIIRDEITADSDFLPSISALYGWIKKSTENKE